MTFGRASASLAGPPACLPFIDCHVAVVACVSVGLLAGLSYLTDLSVAQQRANSALEPAA
jgi:hypothetical protein